MLKKVYFFYLFLLFKGVMSSLCTVNEKIQYEQPRIIFYRHDCFLKALFSSCDRCVGVFEIQSGVSAKCNYCVILIQFIFLDVFLSEGNVSIVQISLHCL